MTHVTRTRMLWLAGGTLVLGGLLLGARLWLGAYIVRSMLGMAGASRVRFAEVRGTPWLLEVRDLEFNLRLRHVAARRVVLAREKWWQVSLGDVRIEGARMVVVLDGSDVNPWDWSTYERGTGQEAVQLPFRTLQLQGELIARMGTVPDMPLAIRLDGRPAGDGAWSGTLVAEGPGFRMMGSGALLRAGQELDFKVQAAALDLGRWARQVQRLMVLPGGPWEMGGELTGEGEGKVTANRFAATARFAIRNGRMRAGMQDVSADGASVDFEFSDLWKRRVRTGRLRLDRLRVGRLELRDVAADFGLRDGRQFTVEHTRFEALGGHVTVDPFRHDLNDRWLSVTLRPEGLSAARLLALAEGKLPRLVGRIDGVLPVRIHDRGVHAQEGGFLKLRAGDPAEMQINAVEILRSNAEMDESSRDVFKAAVPQNVAVLLDAMKLDVRPPGLGLGISAAVTVSGRVNERAIAFTYPVNGPVERYLRIMP